MNLVAFILAAWGVTAIITLSSLFRPVRRFFAARSQFLGELFSCPQCLGFWVGLTLAFFWPLGLEISRPMEILSQAAISSGIGLFGSAFLLLAGWETE